MRAFGYFGCLTDTQADYGAPERLVRDGEALEVTLTPAEGKKLTAQKDRLTSMIKNIRYLNKRSMDFVNVQLGEIEREASIASIYNTKGLSDSHLTNSNLLNKQI